MTAEAALKALAEPNRLEILRLTRDQARSVGEIAGYFDISMQAVSQHLRVLKEAGLVSEQRDGVRRLYAVQPAGLRAVRDIIEELWPARLQRLERLSETRARSTRGR